MKENETKNTGGEEGVYSVGIHTAAYGRVQRKDAIMLRFAHTCRLQDNAFPMPATAASPGGNALLVVLVNPRTHGNSQHRAQEPPTNKLYMKPIMATDVFTADSRAT